MAIRRFSANFKIKYILKKERGEKNPFGVTVGFSPYVEINEDSVKINMLAQEKFKEKPNVYPIEILIGTVTLEVQKERFLKKVHFVHNYYLDGELLPETEVGRFYDTASEEELKEIIEASQDADKLTAVQIKNSGGE